MFTIVFMAYYFYGLRAVLVAGVSVFVSFLTEYLCCAARKIKFDWGDMSPLMSGLLLALLMPASLPYTVMAFASAFMASVCKHAFGGNKNLIFCPVCVSYIFTTLCFPAEILRYPEPTPFGSIPLSNTVGDALSRSYTYYLDSGTKSAFSLLDTVWGRITGPMGSSAALIILISAVALYFFGDIPAAALFSGFGANVLLNVLFPFGEAGWYAVLDSLVAGSYLFTLVFMACDQRFIPKKEFSQAVFGVLFAVGSYLIRRYTGIENSAVFVLPILCVFKGEFDRLTDALRRLLKLCAKKLTELAKLIAKGFDRFCEFLSDKIIAAKKAYDAKKAEEDEEKASEDVVEETSEETGKPSEDEVEETSEETVKPSEDVAEETSEESEEPSEDEVEETSEETEKTSEDVAEETSEETSGGENDSEAQK